ncbi:hypothetical protein AAG906_000334 [Vitis piasezkii]
MSSSFFHLVVLSTVWMLRMWRRNPRNLFCWVQEIEKILLVLGFCDVCVDQGLWMLLQEKVELNWDKMDENDVSMEIQEISLDHNQRLPVSQKIDELSTETQTLKGHTILCNEVKSINADSSPGPEVYDALLFLGMSSSLTTTDILYPSSRGVLIGL